MLWRRVGRGRRSELSENGRGWGLVAETVASGIGGSGDWLGNALEGLAKAFGRNITIREHVLESNFIRLNNKDAHLLHHIPTPEVNGEAGDDIGAD